MLKVSSVISIEQICVLQSASGIIFPIIKAEGVRQMFFPATVPAYHRARAPPVKCDIQKDVASKDQQS